jgi:phage-related baseplate assembly protein
MPNTATMDDIKGFLTPDYVDLSSLPPPKIIEELSFEDIFEELLIDFKKRKPDYDALLESDPAIIALEVCAYREMLLRQRINEAAKANMLAYATGTDLDNKVADYGITRLENEDDSRLRYRALLSLESLTTAGSEKAYLFHALTADPRVKSASVYSPSPGRVLISILSDTGAADEELINVVGDYVSAEDKRPLTDDVVVQSAELVPYKIHAKVHVYFSPSMSITEQECRDGLAKYTEKHNTIGNIVAKSGIFDALHAEGVQRVELLSPANDVGTSKQQAPQCTETNIEFVIVNDTK